VSGRTERLVDRIVEIDAERVVGIKNVTHNEPFFAGHFADFPVMPGVLIVEAMAQAAGVLVLRGIPEIASVGFLGAWAGAHAMRNGGRVVYSPFMSGISDLDWDALVDEKELALFEEMNGNAIPDRRFYSPHLSLREPFQPEE